MRVISAFFSILMPGVGQMYNGQFIKGIVFMIIEHFDNVFGNINKAIYLDFNGFHQEALQTLEHSHAMFYPGFYVYVVWDALYHAQPNGNKKSAVLFVVAGFLGEITSIFARHLPIPTLTIGLSMLIPMIIAIIIYRNWNEVFPQMQMFLVYLTISINLLIFKFMPKRLNKYEIYITWGIILQ